MQRILAVLVCSVVLSSSAFAQVFYQPVQYQFDTGRGDGKYLYGGTNPQIHSLANRYGGAYGYTVSLHNFDGGNSFGQPSPMYNREVVYSDCVGTQVASHFGFNEANARNEAYANVPRYFRKADLLASAVPAGDGTLVVPATAPHASAAPSQNYSTLSGMPPRGQIIIIPKRLLDRPLKDFQPDPLKVAVSQ